MSLLMTKLSRGWYSSSQTNSDPFVRFNKMPEETVATQKVSENLNLHYQKSVDQSVLHVFLQKDC